MEFTKVYPSESKKEKVFSPKEYNQIEEIVTGLIRCVNNLKLNDSENVGNFLFILCNSNVNVIDILRGKELYEGLALVGVMDCIYDILIHLPYADRPPTTDFLCSSLFAVLDNIQCRQTMDVYVDYPMFLTRKANLTNAELKMLVENINKLTFLERLSTLTMCIKMKMGKEISYMIDNINPTGVNKEAMDKIVKMMKITCESSKIFHQSYPKLKCSKLLILDLLARIRSIYLLYKEF